MIINSLLVAAGGVLGAFCRYIVSGWFTKGSPVSFPWGTLVVNLTGSFMLGLLWGAVRPHSLTLLMGTGFLGAYTTFSTLNVESVQLIKRGKGQTAVLYLVISYTIGILAAFLGYCSAK